METWQFSPWFILWQTLARESNRRKSIISLVEPLIVYQDPRSEPNNGFGDIPAWEESE